MMVHWVLPIVGEDGGSVDLTKFSEATVLPRQDDVVELDGEALSVGVDCMIAQGFMPLVKFMPYKATRQQIDRLRLNGWVERKNWSRSKKIPADINQRGSG